MWRFQPFSEDEHLIFKETEGGGHWALKPERGRGMGGHED